MKIIRHQAIILIFLSLHITPLHAAQNSPGDTNAGDKKALIADCDRLAGHPDDTSHQGPGVKREELNVNEALPACKQAMEAFPNIPRLKYQYARTLWAADRTQDAIKLVEQAGSAGHAMSQAGLCAVYYKGRGVTRDYAKAAEWCKMAAEQGDDVAQSYLGWLYMEGAGVPADNEKAAEWLRKAAEQGNVYGQLWLGWMNESGALSSSSLAEARRWYEKAAAQGNTYAKEKLDELRQVQ